MKAIGKVMQWTMIMIGSITVLCAAYLQAAEMLNKFVCADEIDCE